MTIGQLEKIAVVLTLGISALGVTAFIVNYEIKRRMKAGEL